jgi:hypothetical protein
MPIIYNVIHTRPSTDVKWISEEDPDFILDFQSKTQELIDAGHIISFVHSYPNDLEHRATLTITNEASDSLIMSDPQWRFFVDSIHNNYVAKGITTIQTRVVE